MEFQLTLAGIIVIAAAMTAALTVVLMPLCRAYALARPNSRSSHREPTPQGGGAAVVVSVLCIGWGALIVSGAYAAGDGMRLAALTVAVILLALAGAADDVRGLSPMSRLVVQSIAVGLIVAWLPDQPVVAMLPGWLERTLFFFGGVWFVNLVNFMDGIDWMTVAEVVPITGAILLIGWIDLLPPALLIVSAALLGAMVGFAPFNKPVARLFLGDVGSLPIGLILGWLLLILAANGQLAAAILLPLYYLADATLTLGMRLWRGERVWLAHRDHFYQRALAGRLTVPGVVGLVFATNLGLGALAVACAAANNIAVSGASLAAGSGLVALLLLHFSRSSNRP